VRWRTILLVGLLVVPGWSGCVFLKPDHQATVPPMSEWAFNDTQLDWMNAMGFSGRSVRVALIDSGIDPSILDFSGFCVTVWKDLVNGRTEPYDDDGHGTMMAGIIWGERGGARNVSLMVIKAIDAGGSGSDSTVATAINYATDPNQDGDHSDGADIISLSLGEARYLRMGQDAARAAEAAVSLGIFVVAAAGNEGNSGTGDVDSPASARDVIAVGAIDSGMVIAPFSSGGINSGSLIPFVLPRSDPDKKPELVAPGVDIIMPAPAGQYDSASGTSISTVFVTTAIALILEALPQYRHSGNDGQATVARFKQAFMDTASKLGSQQVPHDDHYGYGLVIARDAYLDLAA
jgi:serine protease AprX